MVPVTNAQRGKHRPDDHTRTPSAASAPAVTSAESVGHKNCPLKLSTVDLRHASSGPTPVRKRRINPTGIIHFVKNGAATVRRSPVIASVSVGNIVANRMKN